MTLRPEVILRSELEVLRRQRAWVRRDPGRRRALREGIRRACAKHGPDVSAQLAEHVREGSWGQAGRLALVLARHHRSGLASTGAAVVMHAARSLGRARGNGT
jgi:hypothetical protein